MGRKQAKRELDYNSEVKKLNDAGIIHSIKSAENLDEAPSAYKSIDDVLMNEVDLVKPITKLTPLAVIKG